MTLEAHFADIQLLVVPLSLAAPARGNSKTVDPAAKPGSIQEPVSYLPQGPEITGYLFGREHKWAKIGNSKGQKVG